MKRSFMGRLKAVIERHNPHVARLYRMVRDEIHYQRLTPVITPDGFRFVGDSTMQMGSFEPDETEIIKSRLENADILVDIGANAGLYTCLARNLGKHVIAIEPHPQNLRLLYRNLEENGWQDVEVWPIGLAASPTVITLYGGNTGASVVKGWADIPDSWKQTIAVHTLDHILGSRFVGKRIVIKVDVEGAEYGVLQGALNTLKRLPKPIWLMEITLTLNHPGMNQKFLQTFDAFWENGYEVRTGDHKLELVTRSDVKRWVSAGVCDFGTHNWLFVPDTGK
jgi:FkbM family methyltransferase